MSEIPYYFETPVPKFFRENGFLKNPKNTAFITWAFSKCSTETKTIFHDNKKITLDAYQFIFGRLACCEETGLSEDEVRTQQKRWENLGFLKKAPNKTPNRFTVYTWSTSLFLKIDPQQKPRSTPKRPPTNPHKLEDKKIRSKEYHPPTSFFSKSDGSDDDDDDSFFSADIKKTQGKIHIYGDVWMGEDELAKCVAIKGSIEEVKYAVEAIIVSPGRSDTIKNWPNALSRWKIQPNIKPRLIENEEIAKELESRYSDFKDGKGIRCYVYNDRMKDIKGLLFEGDNPYKPVREFFAFSDVNFKEKVTRFQFEKKMAKGSLK